jgi:hypothetical protein
MIDMAHLYPSNTSSKMVGRKERVVTVNKKGMLDVLGY